MIELFKLMTLRAFFLFAIAILIIVLVLVNCYYVGKCNRLKKANEIIHYPAKSYQDKNIMIHIDTNKKFVYITHSVIDRDNINLEPNVSINYSILKSLLEINKKYNIALIHNSIMEENNSYTISKLITYMNINRLPICRICAVANNSSFYTNLDNLYDKDGKFFYYVEKENDVKDV